MRWYGVRNLPGERPKANRPLELQWRSLWGRSREEARSEGPRVSRAGGAASASAGAVADAVPDAVPVADAVPDAVPVPVAPVRRTKGGASGARGAAAVSVASREPISVRAHHADAAAQAIIARPVIANDAARRTRARALPGASSASSRAARIAVEEAKRRSRS